MKIVRIAFFFCLACLPLLNAQQPSTKVVQSVLHDNDGTRTDTETDFEARTQKVTNLNASGEITQRTLYRLDEKNQPDAGIVYDPKNRILYKMKLKRDNIGRLIEEIDYTANDKFLRRLTFTYDGQGRLYQIDAYDEAGKLTGTSVGKEKKSRRKK